MRNFVVLILLSTSLLFADVEPNNMCNTSEVVTFLDGIQNSISYQMKGSIVGLEIQEGEEKPQYERDFYHFTVQSDGELTISRKADGHANYLHIGTQGCGSKNILEDFSTSVNKTFKVSKGQRIDLFTFCRYSNDYIIDIAFKSDSITKLPKDELNSSELKSALTHVNALISRVLKKLKSVE